MPTHQLACCVWRRRTSHLLKDVIQQQIKISDAFDLAELGRALSQYTPEDFVNQGAELDSTEPS
jgi:hypothetical protein